MATAKQVAAAALAKCAAFDPWFPKPDRAMVEAWAELIDRHGITMDQGLAAVTRMYDDNGSGFKPLPRDFIRAARETRLSVPETETERDLRNLENDKRLGLDTSWYKTADQLAAITDADGRRKAIESFALGYGNTAVVLPPSEPVEVPQIVAQPQELPPEPDSDDCPHCHYPNGCLVTHPCLGMDYSRQ